MLYTEMPKDEDLAEVHGQVSHRRQGPFRVVVLIFTFALFLSYVANETATGGFLATYGEEASGIDMSPATASLLNTVFWATFAFGRFLAIFVSAHVKPTYILYFNYSGAFIAVVVLNIMPTSGACAII